jgi:DNA polymerase I-like protein with 3'-5' exonuclease and polymerase domains
MENNYSAMQKLAMGYVDETNKYRVKGEWVHPEKFPDLTGHKVIAIDLETRDPNLKTLGSGAIIGEGNIIGFGVATENFKAYYPVAHERGPNLDSDKVRRYIQSILSSPTLKVFHNAMYDISWLRSEGYKVQGPIADTMLAASLLDENRRSFTLDSVGWTYLNEGKNDKLLVEAAKEAMVDPKGEMYKLTPAVVGPYAEQDVYLTLNLWKILEPLLRQEGLYSSFHLEMELFWCLVDMRFLGVRVDEMEAARKKIELIKEEKKVLHKIKKLTGQDVEIWAARSISKAFDQQKIKYWVTEKTGAPSFTKGWLATRKEELPQLILKARELNKAHTTFIQAILKHVHNGRIHADINQLRSDQGGTVTGRFSYANPNLQQIPARNKDLGPMIRSLFIPEEGCKWAVFDYNQQEPRLVAHYAKKKKCRGIDPLIFQYLNAEKTTDFHQLVADMADIERSEAKTINLGLFYGMGKNKLADSLGLTLAEARDLFNQYHKQVPFVGELSQKMSKEALEKKEITTLLGRKCRFPLWGPVGFNREVPYEHKKALLEYAKKLTKNELERIEELNKQLTPDNKKEIEEEITNIKMNAKTYPNLIETAYTYRALNRLIQGSAADMTKKCMVDLYSEGIVAHIQIHDELDLSLEHEDKAKRIIEIMEHAVELEVPNKVDFQIGDSWGDMH